MENESHISSLFMEGVKDSFLFQQVKEPTGYRQGQEQSILDLIFKNEENMMETIEYLPTLRRSDHLVLSFNFNCRTSGSLRTFDRYNFNKGKYPACRELLENIDWEQVMQGLGVSESWKSFAEKIVDVIRNYIPVSKTRNNVGRCCPAVATQCMDSIMMKHRKWKKYKYCKNKKILTHIKLPET